MHLSYNTSRVCSDRIDPGHEHAHASHTLTVLAHRWSCVPQAVVVVRVRAAHCARDLRDLQQRLHVDGRRVLVVFAAHLVERGGQLGRHGAVRLLGVAHGGLSEEPLQVVLELLDPRHEVIVEWRPRTVGSREPVRLAQPVRRLAVVVREVLRLPGQLQRVRGEQRDHIIARRVLRAALALGAELVLAVRHHAADKARERVAHDGPRRPVVRHLALVVLGGGDRPLIEPPHLCVANEHVALGALLFPAVHLLVLAHKVGLPAAILMRSLLHHPLHRRARTLGDRDPHQASLHRVALAATFACTAIARHHLHRPHVVVEEEGARAATGALAHADGVLGHALILTGSAARWICAQMLRVSKGVGVLKFHAREEGRRCRRRLGQRLASQGGLVHEGGLVGLALRRRWHHGERSAGEEQHGAAKIRQVCQKKTLDTRHCMRPPGRCSGGAGGMHFQRTACRLHQRQVRVLSRAQPHERLPFFARASDAGRRRLRSPAP
eukprot:scaffold27199_cov48-Phaeocystis_antarctica.AAC.4